MKLWACTPEGVYVYEHGVWKLAPPPKEQEGVIV